MVVGGGDDRPGSLGAEWLRVPKVIDGNHYAAARETDSDIVWFSDRASGNYQEKFLFYRGAGNFEMPVKMQSLGHDRFTIRNAGKEAIRAAFLVNIDPAGRVRYTELSQLADRPITAELPPEASTLESLGQSMVAALTAEGLYDKEARAMVKTWQSSWFGEPGTRLLYLVPRPQTDAILPLKVTPAPSETVRVMVGRLEELTPEMEGQVKSLIGKLGAADCSEQESAERQIRAMGRFAEPALLRVVAGGLDAPEQERLQTLVCRIHDEQ